MGRRLLLALGALLAVAEELQRRAPRAELWVVPGGGHALPVTRPDALADRIAAFARAEPRAGPSGLTGGDP